MMRMIRSSLSRKMQYKSLIHSPSIRSLRNYLLTSVLICLMNTLTGLNAEGMVYTLLVLQNTRISTDYPNPSPLQ